MPSWFYKRFVVIAVIDYTLNFPWYLAAMVAGALPFICSPKVKLELVLLFACVTVCGVLLLWTVLSGCGLVWLWTSGCVPKIRCVPLWCVWVGTLCTYMYAIMHTATYVTCQYKASGPTQLSVACSGVKWEVTYCIAETFKGENSHKFWDFVAIW